MKIKKKHIIKALLSLSFLATLTLGVSSFTICLSKQTQYANKLNINNNNLTHDAESIRSFNTSIPTDVNKSYEPIKKTVNIDSSSWLNYQDDADKTLVKTDHIEKHREVLHYSKYDPDAIFENSFLKFVGSDGTYTLEANSSQEKAMWLDENNYYRTFQSWTGSAVTGSESNVYQIINSSNNVDPFIIPDNNVINTPNAGFTNVSGIYDKVGIQSVSGSRGKKHISVNRGAFDSQGLQKYTQGLQLIGYFQDNPSNSRSSITFDLSEGNPVAFGFQNSASACRNAGSFKMPLGHLAFLKYKDTNNLMLEAIQEEGTEEPIFGGKAKHWRMYSVVDVERLKDGTTKLVSYDCRNNKEHGYRGETKINSVTIDSTKLDKKTIYPSEFVNNLTKYWDSLLFNTEYAINSTFADSTITFETNDWDGELKITIQPNIGIEFLNSKAWYLYDEKQTVYTQGNKVFQTMTLKKMKPVEFVIKDFKTLKINTTLNESINNFSIKEDVNFKNHTVDEFLNLEQRDQLIADFIFKKKEELFNNLPSDLASSDFQVVNISKDDANIRNLNVVLKLNKFIKDSVVVDASIDTNIQPITFTVSLNGFSKGRTQVVGGEFTFTGFENYYAQASVLVSQKQNPPVVSLNQSNVQKPVLFPIKLVNGNITTANGTEFESGTLDDRFLQQLFDSVVTGYKDKLTWKNIAKVSIKSFSNGTKNKEPQIEVDAIYLNAYYINENEDLLKPPLPVKLIPPNPIIIKGFKTLDIPILEFNNEVVIPNQKHQYPSQINTRLLIDILNNNKEKLYNSNQFPNNHFPTKDTLNFQIPNENDFGHIRSILPAPVPNNVDGTFTITSLNILNSFVVSEVNPEEIIFNPNPVTYNLTNPLIIKGFKAERETTQILQTPQQWGMYASDVVNNTNDSRNRFKEMFFQKNIKYPGNATINDLEIDFNKMVADNVNGKLTFDLILHNAIENNIVKDISINGFSVTGFEIQKPTSFIDRNLSIAIPNKVDIYDFSEQQIKQEIINNKDNWISNIPKGLNETNIELFDVLRDFQKKTIFFSFSLNKYYDSKGILINDDKNRLSSPHQYAITNFSVNAPTKPDYRYHYSIPNLADTVINKKYFITPNDSQDLRQHVLDSLLAEKQVGRLSFPEITNDTQSFEIKWDNSTLNQEQTKDYLYGTGEINLVIMLKKYYDAAGRYIDASQSNSPDSKYQPINLFVKLKGWKVFDTSFKQASEFNWGQGNKISTVNKQLIKQLIWTHKDELMIDPLHFDNAEQFMNNLIVDISKPVINNDGTMSVNASITIEQYFQNGQYVNNPKNPLKKQIVIKGFQPEKLTTLFKDINSIQIPSSYPELINEITPSTLAKGDIPNKFKEFVIDQLLSGYNNISINDVKKIEFANPDNNNGTIVVTRLVINGYDDSYDKVELDTNVKKPGYKVTISGFKKSKQTNLVNKEVTLINSTKYKDIFQVYQNPNLLLSFVRTNWRQIFTDLPEGEESIKSVSINADELIDNDATFVTTKNDKHYKGKLTIRIGLRSYIDSYGVGQYLKDGEEIFFGNKKDETIKVINFNDMEKSKIPAIIQSKFPKTNSNNDVSIFMSDVIDGNWPIIQLGLIEIINDNFAKESDAYNNILPIKRIKDKSTKKDRFEICYVSESAKTDSNNAIIDPENAWDFLADENKQAQVKERFAQKALEAYEAPNFENNASLGRITLPVKLIKGYNKNGTYKVFRSDEELTLSIRTYGLKSTRQTAEKEEWWYLWAVIGGSIGTLSFVIFVVLIAIAINKKRFNQ